MNKTIAVLPGDGIGPEVMQAALKVLKAVGEKFGHSFDFHESPVGGAAYDQFKSHLPDETLEICKKSDAILFGSVGGPVKDQQNEKWKNCEANSVLGIRKAFNFSVNFRPAKVYPALSNICPLKPDLLKDGVDLLIIRELLGDIYFGEHKQYTEGDLRKASDVSEYDEEQIRVAVDQGFKAAMLRGKKLTSVDKANVLSTSKLWREVLEEVSKDYPEVEWQHMLVDNCAMQIIMNPAQFDVIVTSNLFGDILSDAAAVLPGSLGLTPSASLNKDGFGMYEPSGGSAPELTGQGIANPIAQILSAALMLKFSFNLTEEAEAIEAAVEAVISDGIRTKDIAEENQNSVSTEECTQAIIAKIHS